MLDWRAVKPFSVGDRVRLIDHPTVIGEVTRIRLSRHSWNMDVRFLEDVHFTAKRRNKEYTVDYKKGHVIESIAACWTLHQICVFGVWRLVKSV